MQHGYPAFLFGLVALLAGLVSSQSVTGSGIGRHPYAGRATAASWQATVRPSRSGVWS